jgi:hypothetical protein
VPLVRALQQRGIRCPVLTKDAHDRWSAHRLASECS